MRYSEVDLQCEDILWFAIDAHDYVMAFTAGGCGNIPEFICHSREETESLETFFMEMLPISSVGHPLIESNGYSLAEDALALACKGIYCYDVVFEGSHKNDYRKISYPEKPLLLQQLPGEIQAILKHHRLNTDAIHEDFIKVAHAYSDPQIEEH